jgi:hypothetical protein
MGWSSFDLRSNQSLRPQKLIVQILGVKTRGTNVPIGGTNVPKAAQIKCVVVFRSAS